MFRRNFGLAGCEMDILQALLYSVHLTYFLFVLKHVNGSNANLLLKKSHSSKKRTDCPQNNAYNAASEGALAVLRCARLWPGFLYPLPPEQYCRQTAQKAATEQRAHAKHYNIKYFIQQILL